MSDKNLSGEEKRRQMKEQFKRELMQRKEFQKKVKGLRQTQRINKALSDLTPEDDTEDWIRKLEEENAFAEAKAEIALDASMEKYGIDEDPEKQAAKEALEEDMKKISAQALVEKMKAEMAEENKIAHSEEYIPEDGEEPGEEKPGRKTLGDWER